MIKIIEINAYNNDGNDNDKKNSRTVMKVLNCELKQFREKSVIGFSVMGSWF